MKVIKYLEIKYTPTTYLDRPDRLRVEVNINGEKYGIDKLVKVNHFTALFDRILDDAKHTIKNYLNNETHKTT